MKHAVMLAAVLSMVAGCVTDTMRSYVGQDIRQVELAYGPPSNIIDLGNGVQAYQWTRISVSNTPISEVTTTRRDRKGRRTSTTEMTGGQQTESRCLYTFMASWDPRRNAQIVTGIRQPSLDCAIGDIDSG